MTDQRFYQCARCGHTNPMLCGDCGYLNTLPRERKSLFGRVGGVALAAIPIAIGLVTLFSPAETVDIGTARSFLGGYYANAPFQPEVTWERLTDSYKENNEPDLTYDEYMRYFKQFSEASASDVANYEPGRGQWYVASVFRKNKDGTSATTRFAFDLRCPWYTRLPGVSCSPSNLQIANNCEVNTESGLCEQDEAATEIVESNQPHE